MSGGASGGGRGAGEGRAAAAGSRLTLALSADFKSALGTVYQAVEDADFLAIDGEFSGTAADPPTPPSLPPGHEPRSPRPRPQVLLRLQASATGRP